MPKPGHLAALREVIITENIQSTWTRTRVLPTIRTLILDFLDSLTVSWQSVSPLLLWKCSLFWQIVTLILLWKSWLEKENFWEITLWKENPTTRLSDEISPHFTKFIIENNFERHIFNFICWSNQVHRLPNNLNMHQCQHSDQLRPFILLLDHVPDLLSELPGDLVLKLVYLPVHHLVTQVNHLATLVGHLATLMD